MSSAGPTNTFKTPSTGATKLRYLPSGLSASFGRCGLPKNTSRGINLAFMVVSPEALAASVGRFRPARPAIAAINEKNYRRKSASQIWHGGLVMKQLSGEARPRKSPRQRTDRVGEKPGQYSTCTDLAQLQPNFTWAAAKWPLPTVRGRLQSSSLTRYFG